ncbi:hypothetical protein KIL84_001076 [Mauremys mutica]|uniref:Uncharacterized protein n=1 Tax=Mauremys mutica TaxID=74926 RepID=A0A9D3WYG3_9SAUR|nr:hypothetical protein KIL84_001076 [Mauremys mutica]
MVLASLCAKRSNLQESCDEIVLGLTAAAAAVKEVNGHEVIQLAPGIGKLYRTLTPLLSAMETLPVPHLSLLPGDSWPFSHVQVCGNCFTSKGNQIPTVQASGRMLFPMCIKTAGWKAGISVI